MSPADDASGLRSRLSTPLGAACLILLLVAVVLVVLEGLTPFVQTTINGLVVGIFFALGAVGLTLVYGVLRLVNFAQGDMMTLGAYLLVAAQAVGLPFIVGTGVAIVGVALLATVLELVMWRPMRKKGAGLFHLFVMSLGLAFLLRYLIQFVAGSNTRPLGVDVISSVSFGEFRIGRTNLFMALAGAAIIVGLGVVLRITSLGRQVRAVSDSSDLAETTGIDSTRIVRVIWLLSGGLAGLAGVLYGSSLGAVSPQFGYEVVLTLFAAMIIGGIGNAYGALLGGIVIGLTQEWSTLVIDPSLKVAVGFALMIVVLILRPQGLLGWARTAEA